LFEKYSPKTSVKVNHLMPRAKEPTMKTIGRTGSAILLIVVIIATAPKAAGSFLQ
jgi:hypothetical protein